MGANLKNLIVSVWLICGFVGVCWACVSIFFRSNIPPFKKCGSDEKTKISLALLELYFGWIPKLGEVPIFFSGFKCVRL